MKFTKKKTHTIASKRIEMVPQKVHTTERSNRFIIYLFIRLVCGQNKICAINSFYIVDFSRRLTHGADRYSLSALYIFLRHLVAWHLETKCTVLWILVWNLVPSKNSNSVWLHMNAKDDLWKLDQKQKMFKIKSYVVCCYINLSQYYIKEFLLQDGYTCPHNVDVCCTRVLVRICSGVGVSTHTIYSDLANRCIPITLMRCTMNIFGIVVGGVCIMYSLLHSHAHTQTSHIAS